MNTEQKVRLRELIIQQAKFTGTPKKLFDGGGLFLYITKSGKYWYYRYRYQGKDKVLSLGKYPVISLKKARELHIAAKSVLLAGDDPNQEKEQAKAKRTATRQSFRAIADEWYQHKKPGWKNPKHAQQVINTLTTYVFPHIGDRDITHIMPVEVFQILSAISDKPETASRVKQRINAVFDFAIQTGRTTYIVQSSKAQPNPKQIKE
ncbi:tyrosine-type recombinase/integrase [Suttonella ornithocola]|uniref:Prophage CPS-53 integrase n=1 Tax=Suttonella ornithocola TaxID=279832 RepID=A0A380MXL8_9GAMM|nr:integrase arm-type DNA-binding domain-containing protein [Suttonella ornithocola]SUO96643.1 Putative prophage CPS-53 integrase [Suttonella ornithocola]